MKSFVVFAAVLACAYAKPGFFGFPGFGYAGVGAPVQYAAAPVQYAAAPAYYSAPAFVAPAYTKTQYHAQDEFGQASHGYAHPGQAAAEVRDAFGNVRGSYAYVDPNGKEVRVNYVADAVNGFRVESNALPVGPSVPETPALIAPEPVQDTPEVVEARAAHARAVEAAGAAAAAAPENAEEVTTAEAPAVEEAPVVAAPLVAPEPVQDTPEVVEARAAHAVAFQAAAAAAAVQPERRRKRGLVYSYPTYAHAPLYATYAAHPVVYTIASPVVAPLVTPEKANLVKTEHPNKAVSYVF